MSFARFTAAAWRLAVLSGMALAGAALLNPFALVALAPATAAGEKSPPPVDPARYAALMEGLVETPEDLADRYAAGRSVFVPLLPPAPDFVLRQPAQAPAVPFDPAGFSPQFLEGLGATFENTVPVYPVRLAEDPATRRLLFLSASGAVVHSLDPAPGYDPYADLKALRPWLYGGGWPLDRVREQERLHDPARVQMEYRLVDAADLERWLYAAQAVEAYRLQLTQEEADEEPMMMLM